MEESNPIDPDVVDNDGEIDLKKAGYSHKGNCVNKYKADWSQAMCGSEPCGEKVTSHFSTSQMGLAACPGYYKWSDYISPDFRDTVSIAAGGRGLEQSATVNNPLSSRKYQHQYRSSITADDLQQLKTQGARKVVKAGQTFDAPLHLVSNHQGAVHWILAPAHCNDVSKCFDEKYEGTRILKFNDDATDPTLNSTYRMLPMDRRMHSSDNTTVGDEKWKGGEWKVQIPADVPEGDYTLLVRWDSAFEKAIFSIAHDIKIQSDDDCDDEPQDQGVRGGNGDSDDEIAQWNGDDSATDIAAMADEINKWNDNGDSADFAEKL